MAEIFVEGLGNVNIEGNTPTLEEQQSIIEQLKKKEPKENIAETQNTEEQKTKSFVEGAIDAFKTRDTALMAGGMGGFASGARLGAMGGGMVGSLPGAIVGGIVGGTLGATGFGQVYDIVDSYIQGDNKTFDESAKQALKDAKRETMFGMIGSTIPGVKPAITRLLSKREKGELIGKDVKELYDAGKRIGVDILPMDISGKVGKTYGRVVGVFPIVGRPLKTAAEKRGRQLNLVKDQVLNELAPNSHISDLGVDMFNAARKSSKEFRKVSGDLYKVFYEQASQINKPFIPSKNIKESANTIIKEFLQQRPKEVLTKTVVRNGKKVKIKIKKPIKAAVNQKYSNFIRSLSRLDDFVTPAQIKKIKQDLNYYSDLVAGKDGAGIFRLTKMSKAADGALRDFDNYNLSVFAKDPTITPKTLQKMVADLKKADAFYANGIQIYNRSTAGRFRKADKNIFMAGFDKPGSIEPDELFSHVIKTGSPQSLKDLRKLIGDDNFSKVARKIVDNAFTKSAIKDDKSRNLLFNPYVLEQELGAIGKNPELLENLVKGTKLNKQKLLDLIEVSKSHANLEIPDVNSFIQRRITLGGAKSILGAFALGAGVIADPVAVGALIGITNRTSAFFANPKNVELAIEALDITAPRSIRYVAGEKLLRGYVKDTEGDEKEIYENLLKEYQENKSNILEEMRDS